MCYRCGKKTQCSQRYRATSTNPVSTKAQGILKIDTSNAKKENIQCCVACISPGSRMELHKKEVFERPENLFLNYIVAKIDNEITGLEKTFNVEEITQTNPDKKDKYDMLLSKGNKYMLVEVDEQQHFEKKKFHEDRTREKRFWNTYGTQYPVLRIRVGDGKNNTEKLNACIKRQRDKCSIIDQEKFNTNMSQVINHIVKYFNGSKVTQHAYIEFFNYTGIQDFKQVFEYTPAKANKPSEYAHVKYPNDIVSQMENLNIQDQTQSSSKCICNATKKDGDKCTNPCKFGTKCGTHKNK